MPEQQMSEGQRKFWFYACIALVVAGIAFYWFWGLTFGTWNLFATESLGAYSIFILMIGFGLIGAVLMRKRPTAQK